MHDPLDATFAILERLRWNASRLLQFCDAEWAELQSIQECAPEEAIWKARRIRDQLRVRINSDFFLEYGESYDEI